MNGNEEYLVNDQNTFRIFQKMCKQCQKEELAAEKKVSGKFFRNVTNFQNPETTEKEYSGQIRVENIFKKKHDE